MKVFTIVVQLVLHLVDACWTGCQRSQEWKGSNSAQMQRHLAILYTYQCQSTQAQLKPRVLQEKWKIHVIKWDLFQQHHHLVLSTSIVTHSLEGGEGLKRSKTSPNGPKSSAACCFFNCISALVAEEQMVHELHLWGLYILFSPSKS